MRLCGILIILLIVKTDLTVQNNLNPEIVKLTIYYESLCPASVAFYFGSFFPAVMEILPQLEIETNPYGFASTSTDGNVTEFHCQHGPNECYGNKLQACAIYLNNNDTKSYIPINACLLHRGSNMDAVQECRDYFEYDLNELVNCANSQLGSNLLAAYGEKMQQITPHVPQLPYIVMNGVGIGETKSFSERLCKEFKITPGNCNS